MITKLFKNTNITIEKLENELLSDTFNPSNADLIIENKKVNLDETNQNGNTLLHVCLKNNRYRAANWLIKQGVSLSIKNKNNISTMRIAVEKGNLSVIKTIIEYANEDINQVDEHGRSLLQDAIILGNNDVAQLLIENSIDLNIRDNNNRNVVFDAIAYGDDNMIDNIISKDGVDLNIIDSNGDTILHDKKVRDDDDLAKKLLEHGADPTIDNSQGDNYLKEVALRGDVGDAMLNVALKYGGDLKLKTASKNSIMMEVMFSFSKLSKSESDRRAGLKEVAKTLIKHGLDTNAINKKNETALFDMVRAQDIEGCAFLLGNGINVNHKNNFHETALSIAILKGIENLDIIILLLQYDADPTLKNKHNETVPELLNNIILHIHNLKELKNQKILNQISFSGNYMLLLKELLHMKNFDFNYLDSAGDPLFFKPFIYGDTQTCKLYLQHGLDINAKNSNGHNIFYEYVLNIFRKNEYLDSFRENLVFLLFNNADIKSVNKHGQTIYTKIALIHNCNLKLFRKLIEVTRYDYSSVDNLGRTIIHSCVWGNNIELLKLVYGVEKNIQNISDDFNILPITYAALLGNRSMVTEFLRRSTIITSDKKILKGAREKFQPMLKNLNKLTDGIENKDDLRKLEIFKEQIIKDLTL
ncbi:MAG: ankyrin repeat domain-containing protein [Campylobacterota bacterium]|nr:ankyrin repeat domain-containing protein [Campylobacterota bacterium]